MTTFAVGVTLVLCVAFAVTHRLLTGTVQEQRDETAERLASQSLQALESFRTLYTSEVVNRLPPDVPITHDYAHRTGAIPLPATLTIQLAEHTGSRGTGMRARLYSEYPFPWRERGASLDDFERAALEALSANPLQPYFTYETVDSVRYLRYAKADVMRPSCVKCHNSHPDSPKTDWQAGDLRGVLSIIVPQREDARRALAALSTLMGVFAGIGLVVLALGWRVLSRVEATD